VKAHFEEFMRQLKIEINPEIVKGACDQKIAPEDIIELLENLQKKQYVNFEIPTVTSYLDDEEELVSLEE
jgi:hypothetical protein